MWSPKASLDQSSDSASLDPIDTEFRDGVLGVLEEETKTDCVHISIFPHSSHNPFSSLSNYFLPC